MREVVGGATLASIEMVLLSLPVVIPISSVEAVDPLRSRLFEGASIVLLTAW